jgi:hypothetical protein
VEDRPGGLNSILEILKANKINVEYMYAFVRHTGKNAVMIFRFDNIAAATEILNSKGVTILNEEQLNAL